MWRLWAGASAVRAFAKRSAMMHRASPFRRMQTTAAALLDSPQAPTHALMQTSSRAAASASPGHATAVSTIESDSAPVVPPRSVRARRKHSASLPAPPPAVFIVPPTPALPAVSSARLSQSMRLRKSRTPALVVRTRALLEAAIVSGDLTRVATAVEEVERARGAMDETCYALVFSFCAPINLSRARELARRCRARLHGLLEDHTTTEQTLIDAQRHYARDLMPLLLQQQQCLLACEVVRWLEERADVIHAAAPAGRSAPLQLDSTLYLLAMETCELARDPASSVKLLASMLRRGASHSREPFIILLRALVRSEEWSAAEELLEFIARYTSVRLGADGWMRVHPLLQANLFLDQGEPVAPRPGARLPLLPPLSAAALSFYSRGSSLLGVHPAALFNLALAHVRQGSLQAAQESLAATLQLSPAFPQAQRWLDWTEDALAREALEVRVVEEAVDAVPSAAEFVKVTRIDFPRAQPIARVDSLDASSREHEIAILHADEVEPAEAAAPPTSILGFLGVDAEQRKVVRSTRTASTVRAARPSAASAKDQLPNFTEQREFSKAMHLAVRGDVDALEELLLVRSPTENGASASALAPTPLLQSLAPSQLAELLEALFAGTSDAPFFNPRGQQAPPRFVSPGAARGAELVLSVAAHSSSAAHLLAGLEHAPAESRSVILQSLVVLQRGAEVVRLCVAWLQSPTRDDGAADASLSSWQPQPVDAHAVLRALHDAKRWHDVAYLHHGLYFPPAAAFGREVDVATKASSDVSEPTAASPSSADVSPDVLLLSSSFLSRGVRLESDMSSCILALSALSQLRDWTSSAALFARMHSAEQRREVPLPMHVYALMLQTAARAQVSHVELVEQIALSGLRELRSRRMLAASQRSKASGPRDASDLRANRIINALLMYYLSRELFSPALELLTHWSHDMQSKSKSGLKGERERRGVGRTGGTRTALRHALYGLVSTLQPDQPDEYTYSLMLRECARTGRVDLSSTLMRIVRAQQSPLSSSKGDDRASPFARRRWHRSAHDSRVPFTPAMFMHAINSWNKEATINFHSKPPARPVPDWRDGADATMIGENHADLEHEDEPPHSLPLDTPPPSMARYALEHVEMLLEEMDARGVPRDDGVQNAYLRSLSLAGEVERVQAVLAEMQATATANPGSLRGPSSLSIAHACVACILDGSSSSMKLATSFLSRLEKMQRLADPNLSDADFQQAQVLYVALVMPALLMRNQWSLCLETIQRIESLADARLAQQGHAGIVLSALYIQAMEACEVNYQSSHCVVLMRSLLARHGGVAPVGPYVLLLRALVRVRDWAAAAEVLDHLEAQSPHVHLGLDAWNQVASLVHSLPFEEHRGGGSGGGRISRMAAQQAAMAGRGSKAFPLYHDLMAAQDMLREWSHDTHADTLLGAADSMVGHSSSAADIATRDSSSAHASADSLAAARFYSSPRRSLGPASPHSEVTALSPFFSAAYADQQSLLAPLMRTVLPPPGVSVLQALRGLLQQRLDDKARREDSREH